MNLRRTLLPVHRWTGLTLGLIVLLSALTGAGLAFRKQLDPIVYPALVQQSRCQHIASVEDMVGRAKAAHPRGKVDFVRILSGSQAPLTVRFLDKDTYYFDRCSGALLGQQNRYGGVFGTLEWLHRGRWLPFGDWVMGSGALAVLLGLVSLGLHQWWPRRPRRLRDGFVLNRKLRGPAFYNGLHRTVGAWVALPLILSALTGLPNAFEFLHSSLDRLGGSTETKPLAGRIVEPRGAISVTNVIATIERLTPGAQETLIHLDQKPGAPIEAYVIEANAPHANARTYIYFDATSGRVVSYRPYALLGFGSRVYYWMLSLHTGALGLVGQIFIFAGAAGGLVLGYTGIWLYLRRKLKIRAPTAWRASRARAPSTSYSKDPARGSRDQEGSPQPQ